MRAPEKLPMLTPPPGHRRAFSRRRFTLLGRHYVWVGRATSESVVAGMLCVLGMAGIIIGMIQLFIALIAVAAVLVFPAITLIVSSLLIKVSFMFSEGDLKLKRWRRD